jgi:hypothetical protein
MHCRHVVTDEVIVLYNLMPKPVFPPAGPSALQPATDD